MEPQNDRINSNLDKIRNDPIFNAATEKILIEFGNAQASQLMVRCSFCLMHISDLSRKYSI